MVEKELVKSLWVVLNNKVQKLDEVNATELDEYLEKLEDSKEFLSKGKILPTTKYLVFLGRRENEENLKVIGFARLPKITLLKDLRKIGIDEAQRQWKRLGEEEEKAYRKKAIWFTILMTAFIFGMFLFGVYLGIKWNPRVE